MVAHRSVKLHGGGARVHEKRRAKRAACRKVRMLQLSSCSPSVLVPPTYHHHHHHHQPHIITDSLLNCQIELSGGHLFNKYCLVYCNEKERIFFFFIRGGHRWKIKILSRIVEMKQFDTSVLFGSGSQLKLPSEMNLHTTIPHFTRFCTARLDFFVSS